ncbi:MAG: NADPH-dependent F420 reductase [Candidatus Marsarchaeota archaeon]|nr:NADPH-dependent F420 reductase [Candidatus Marsarchaeota archaeon]
MRIAIIGGTGDLGAGLVKRFSLTNDVVLGSRDPKKASDLASKILEEVKASGNKASLTGADNSTAVSSADVSILAVPHEYALDTAKSLAGRFKKGSMLISPVVPMVKTQNGFAHSPPSGFKSMAEAVASTLGAEIDVLAAFHTLPAHRLADLTVQTSFDVPVCGDNPDSVEKAASLIKSVPNLRPLRAGKLSNASLLESMTPLILNVSINNKLRDLTIKFI